MQNQTPRGGVSPEAVSQTFLSAGEERLAPLARALGFEESRGLLAALLRYLFAPWGNRKIGDAALWPSDIGDDHTPFEFSLALGEELSEFRILWEAQGEEPTLASQQKAGLLLTHRLHQDYHIDLERFSRIEDLYLPPDPRGAFAIWHGVSFRRGCSPDFKCYLNPQARGRELAPAIIEETLFRLGFDRAWARLSSIAASRGPARDEFKYISLDLTSHAEARVKVYLRYHSATLADLVAAARLAPSFAAAQAEEFCRTFLGGDGPYREKPVALCFSYTSRDLAAPSSVTFHCPVSHYERSDLEVNARLKSYLGRHGIEAPDYESALAAVVRRPLDAGSGAHSYVSLRSQRRGPRVTVYLAPELYQTGPRRAEGRAAERPLPPAAEIPRYCAGRSVAEHPFLRRLRREPVDLAKLYALMASAYEGISQSFVPWLAQTIARVGDNRVRSILAKQLNDELGGGEPARLHSALLERLLAALSPWAAPDAKDAILAAGRRLKSDVGLHFQAEDPYEAVGAVMASEIYAEQFDRFLKDEFARQRELVPSDLAWLDVHNELEPDHASDSYRLAGFLPDSERALAAVWQGVWGLERAAWSYLDALYALCYPASTLALPS
jgi:DMATS type aromatic prenyltransferase